MKEYCDINENYKIILVLIPLLFTNTFLLDFLPASVFIYHANTATSVTTQLIYPLALFTIRKQWFLYSIISCLMISLHFIVAWFPIVLSTVYLIYICRKKLQVTFGL